LAQLGLTPPVTSRQAPTGASLRVIAIDDDITEIGTPDSPADTFITNVDQLHFFVSYRDMVDGVSWSWVLFHDGAPVQGDALLWSRGSDGAKSFTFDAPDDGYPPGAYVLRLYLNQTEVDQHSFQITKPASG